MSLRRARDLRDHVGIERLVVLPHAIAHERRGRIPDDGDEQNDLAPGPRRPRDLASRSGEETDRETEESRGRKVREPLREDRPDHERDVRDGKESAREEAQPERGERLSPPEHHRESRGHDGAQGADPCRRLAQRANERQRERRVVRGEVDRQERLPHVAKREAQRIRRAHRNGHPDERILELEDARFLGDEKPLDDDETDREEHRDRERESREAPPRGRRERPPRLAGRTAAAPPEQLPEQDDARRDDRVLLDEDRRAGTRRAPPRRGVSRAGRRASRAARGAPRRRRTRPRGARPARRGTSRPRRESWRRRRARPRRRPPPRRTPTRRARTRTSRSRPR